ncbi:protein STRICTOSIDINE SYNTHASE-LIKE 10-like [Punica granatum]|uniref:Protein STRICTOSIDINE SYNTHASE-LIKE 10-like n=1 Tax=Punica granatum TaxID=22663 RepID=A0A6P8D0Y4_PUNGR|nr:protein STRICTOSIDINE SYNTHASE-LIKE 10-like [Punica granatum]
MVDTLRFKPTDCHFGIDFLKYYQLLLPKVVGPESIAFDCRGEGPYVGVSDGRILKWQGSSLGWTEYAYTAPKRNRMICDGSTDPEREQTCGRPLGLKFNNATCSLYIADAYYGLLKVGPRGGTAHQLVASADGMPFRLTNALDIDTATGVVYFTDSSRFYQRWEYVKSIENGDNTGRILKYDSHTNKATTLLKGLSFPNGLALSKDKSFLLVAETGKLQLLRFWLSGPRAGMYEPFMQLARYPDNIKRNENGEFWVALNSGRGIIMTKSLLMTEKEAAGAGGDDGSIPWFKGDPVAVKFGEDGAAVRVLDGMNGRRFESVSELVEFGGTLWVGSVVMPYVGKFKA